MNLNTLLLTLSVAAVTLFWDDSACLASAGAAVAGEAGNREEAGFYDLEGMTEEELEEVCTLRGFELVREKNATTGEPMTYTHLDYVDAAKKCLQLEADLEKVLQEHPEILEDVKRESERVAEERDWLLEQLRRQNETAADAFVEEGRDGGASTSPNSTLTGDSKDVACWGNGLTYDLREISLEVLDRVKSDFTLVINLLLPQEIREMLFLRMKQLIQPALKTVATIAGDMGRTAFDMTNRYLVALANKGRGKGRGPSRAIKVSGLKDASVRKEGLGIRMTSALERLAAYLPVE